jgi:hypothetical protein
MSNVEDSHKLAMLHRVTFLRQAIADADEIRTQILHGRTDDAAYWLRTHLAELMYAWRTELHRLTTSGPVE